MVEVESKNSFQNEGICLHYAIDKISNASEFKVYIILVRMSFGYGERRTRHNNQSYFADKCKMNIRTFQRAVSKLEENGHIMIVKHKAKQFIEGGGSRPNAYSPAFPRGYGAIRFKDANVDAEESVNQQSRQSDARTENNKMEW